MIACGSRKCRFVNKLQVLMSTKGRRNGKFYQHNRSIVLLRDIGTSGCKCSGGSVFRRALSDNDVLFL